MKFRSFFALLVFALVVPNTLLAEQPTSSIQASEETLSSVKKMKESLKDQSKVSSNIVKDTVQPWQQDDSSVDMKANSVRMLQGLGLCVGLFLIGVAIAKRINPKLQVVNEQRLRVCSRMPLTNKTQLILAELDGKEILVAVGQEQVAIVPAVDKLQSVSAEIKPAVISGGKEFLCDEKFKHTA